MITYTVKYKLENSFFWRTLKNIKGDGLFTESNVPSRFFITDQEERIEVPISGTIFMFSKERFMLIKQNMDAEAGQDIKIKK